MLLRPSVAFVRVAAGTRRSLHRETGVTGAGRGASPFNGFMATLIAKSFATLRPMLDM